MNYEPIGGYDHGPACDDGEPERMCPACRVEADRDHIIPEGVDQ